MTDEQLETFHKDYTYAKWQMVNFKSDKDGGDYMYWLGYKEALDFAVGSLEPGKWKALKASKQ